MLLQSRMELTMAHYEQQEFVRQVKFFHPRYFDNVKVLDIGSQDINGNNRVYFSNSNYIGIDVMPGRNVDVVSSGAAFKSEYRFDTVMSTECFEHDESWAETLQNVCNNLLADGGMLVFTCASEGRPEHGTRRTTPKDSPATTDYYMNLTEKHIRSAIDVDAIFKQYGFIQRTEWPQDLYFYGIKKHGTN